MSRRRYGCESAASHRRTATPSGGTWRALVGRHRGAGLYEPLVGWSYGDLGSSGLAEKGLSLFPGYPPVLGFHFEIDVRAVLLKRVVLRSERFSRTRTTLSVARSQRGGASCRQILQMLRAIPAHEPNRSTRRSCTAEIGLHGRSCTTSSASPVESRIGQHPSSERTCERLVSREVTRRTLSGRRPGRHDESCA